MARPIRKMPSGVWKGSGGLVRALKVCNGVNEDFERDDLTPGEVRRLHARHEMPRTRGECPVARPCPWVRCRHHLGGRVSQWNTWHETYPGLELGELRDTCALDCAERGGMTLYEISLRLGVTLTRVRQIEKQALAKMRKRLPRQLLAELLSVVDGYDVESGYPEGGGW